MSDPVPPTTKPPAAPNSAELPPRLLTKLKIEVEGYELLERIGEGGQASVYKAVQKKDGATVAIKILHAGPHATDEARARLKRETAALRALNHPNIVHAIAAGRTRSGLDCLVMNYVDGRPLDALWEDGAFAAAVTPEPPPPPAARLRLFKQICETVQAAHRKGITHRDLSPSNILIDTKGQPHILDFGMASTAFDGIVGRNVTVTGQFIGKLKYASPEQARGANTKGTPDGDVDIRSDVYALGVMLYQLLTNGAFPYEVVGNVIDVLNNIIHSKPRPPSEALSGEGVPPAVPGRPAPAPVRRNPPLVNETIEAIVLKSLEKDPEKRYQSAGELAADIDRYLAGQPTSAAVWSKRPKPASKFSIRHRPVLAAASLILVATLVGVTMNARTLAVWLGLSAVVAPILATDHSPLAPQTADAAMREAAQPDGSERKLSDLARKLAEADARLRAVNEQLANATARKSPELEERTPSSSGPMPADDFCASLAKLSVETGRELKFDALSKEDRDRVKQAEADVIGGQTDLDVLLKRRAELDAEQGALWARLGWGTFAGRDPDKLYRYSLKAPVMGDTNVTAKKKVLDSGITVRRLAHLAMDRGATTLRTAAAQDAGGKADLAKVMGDVAEQLRGALTEFQKAAVAAKDAGNLSDDDRKAVADLQKMADSLRNTLEGAVEHQGQAISAKDEQGRFAARGALQHDLRDATDAASRLDAALVKLAGGWKTEVDLDRPLPDLKLPLVVGKPKLEKPKPVPGEKKQDATKTAVTKIDDVFPKDSTWTGTWQRGNWAAERISGSITSVSGNSATMRWSVPTIGSFDIGFELRGDRIHFVSLTPVGAHQVDGKTPFAGHSNFKISGRADEKARAGSVVLTGEWLFFRPGKEATENNRFEFYRDPTKP